MDEKKKQLMEAWKTIEKTAFPEGDISHLEGKIKEEELLWNYEKIVKQYLKEDDIMLYMGSRDKLLSLKHFPEKTWIAEVWEPDLRLFRAKYEKMGMKVVYVEDQSALPFEDGFFDIVLNRHGVYNLKEVHRILKTEGLFITQQVGGFNNRALLKTLIPDYKPSNLDFCLFNEVKKLKAMGFQLLYSNEDYPYVRYYNTNAVVYMASISPWEFPGFSVESCFDRLCNIERYIQQGGAIESQKHKFIYIAQKN